MRILLILLCMICNKMASAQAILFGFDYVPHPYITDNYGYESSIDALGFGPSSQYELHLGYRFDDTEHSVLSIAYGRGGYGIPTLPSYRRGADAPDWNYLVEYHLFRINYGTWRLTPNGKNAFMPTFGILLAPTQYTFKKSLVDYFGNTYSESYKRNRLNLGVQFGGQYVFKLAGPIFIKSGALIVITPQYRGAFANDPFDGYDPGSMWVPGGGWFPIFNLLFNFGITIELD